MVRQRIAIIPARGGSKRIPGKNIIDFLGKPMIAWTIEAAMRSECFDRVLVSTDDEEIARISKHWGAEAPFLRTDNADDHTPVSMATWGALRQACEYWNETYATVVQLMPNCPLRNEEDVRFAISCYEKRETLFQISCCRYGWMNPWWAVELDNENQPTRIFPGAISQRSQDLPKLYCPTGAIWVANVADFFESKTFYGEGHCFEPLSWKSSVDIDDYEDLDFAKAIAAIIHC